jgi:hypothetical protein
MNWACFIGSMISGGIAASAGIWFGMYLERKKR